MLLGGSAMGSGGRGLSVMRRDGFGLRTGVGCGRLVGNDDDSGEFDGVQDRCLGLVVHAGHDSAQPNGRKQGTHHDCEELGERASEHGGLLLCWTEL